MLQGVHSAILLNSIKLPFVIKIFVLSIFEWPLKTGFTVFSSTVTLKIRTSLRSLKPNQVFIMPQCYIHANLVPICPLVHEKQFFSIKMNIHVLMLEWSHVVMYAFIVSLVHISLR